MPVLAPEAEIIGSYADGTPIYTVRNPDNADLPMRVPYGYDPFTYLAASPEERLQLDIVGEARQTHAENNAAVLGGAGVVGGTQAQAQSDYNAAQNQIQTNRLASANLAAAYDFDALADAQNAGTTAQGENLGNLGYMEGAAAQS